MQFYVLFISVMFIMQSGGGGGGEGDCFTWENMINQKHGNMVNQPAIPSLSLLYEHR